MLGFAVAFIDNRPMPLSVRKSLYACALSAICFALAACERSANVTPRVPQTEPVSSAALETGGRLYADNCAQCHGPIAQGHPDWQNAAAGGYVAAPPLDATGPLPQRSRAALVATIKAGVQRNGEPIMPAWQGRLSDADIDAILAWVLAQWPAAQYEVWRAANTAAASASTHPQ